VEVAGVEIVGEEEFVDEGVDQGFEPRAFCASD
jgi:hypothetical protein